MRPQPRLQLYYSGFSRETESVGCGWWLVRGSEGEREGEGEKENKTVILRNWLEQVSELALFQIHRASRQQSGHSGKS